MDRNKLNFLFPSCMYIVLTMFLRSAVETASLSNFETFSSYTGDVL
jgi:hypothetical protein